MSRADAVRLVKAGKRFLVTCHLKPDGDALGSALGLAAILRELGKEATVFTRDPVPQSLTFLPRSDKVIHDVSPRARYDATFVMDTAARALLPADFPSREVTGPVVIVDHHVVHDDFGDMQVREHDASATGEVVLRLMNALGLKRVPRDAAKPLFTSIVTDTGGFRYNGTTPETLRYGASLVEAGADPWECAYEVFEGWPLGKLRLLAEVLKTLKIHADGKLAVMHVRRSMLARAGANDEMVEGLVNYGRMLRGAEIAALVWELEPIGRGGRRVTQTKVSLRSSGRADVSRVAVALGGGGHRAAAATTMTVGIPAATKRTLEEAKRELKRLDGPAGRPTVPAKARARRRSS